MGWLNQVIVTTVSDHFRRHHPKREAKVEKFEELEIANDELENDSSQELSKCVTGCMKKLSSEERDLIKRVEFKGEAQKEVAKAKSLSYSTLKSKVQNARKHLKSTIIKCCSVSLDSRNKITNIAPKSSDCC
jgi:RNA polymerase sigma-70 factor, ECF subfamily